MVRRREHETEPRLADALGDAIRTDLDVDTERGQRVGRAGPGGQRAVAMLGDRTPQPATMKAAQVETL